MRLIGPIEVRKRLIITSLPDRTEMASPAASGTPRGMIVWSVQRSSIEIETAIRAGEAHLMQARAARLLRTGERQTMSWPVTVKGVCADPDGRVLLCRNHRGQWELPGGRPEIGELFEDAVARECQEETGLTVAVNGLMGVEPLEVLPGRWVDVVAFRCVSRSRATLRESDEHTEVGFIDPLTLTDDELPSAYRHLMNATANDPASARDR